MAQDQTPIVKLELTVEQVNVVLSALHQAPLPLVMSSPLINQIREEAKKQVEPPEPETEARPTPFKKVK